MTVAKEPGHRGEHEISRKTIACGNAGMFRCLVVTNARVYYTTRAAAGASGARHSPRPRFSWADGSCKTRANHAAGLQTCISPSLRGALLSAEAPPSGEGGCDEAIQLSISRS